MTNGKENYRVLPRWNLEAIGAIGANLRPFSYGGSIWPLRWSAQPWLTFIWRRGGVRVCGDAVIFISTRGIAVSKH